LMLPAASCRESSILKVALFRVCILIIFSVIPDLIRDPGAFEGTGFPLSRE
jgi:hypothetical protein